MTIKNINTEIADALFKHVGLLKPRFQIVHQLKRFTPADSGREPFIRVNLYRNRPVRIGMSDGNESLLKGVLQLTVTHVPSSDAWFKSEIDYLDMAGELIDHFPADLKLREGETIVTIAQLGEVGVLQSEANQVRLPVSIIWQVDN